MNSFKPITEPEAWAQCDNCGLRCKAKALERISDPGERLCAGETVPVGQCGECGALCHPLSLPPDPDGRNDDRAAWAYAAIEAFIVQTQAEPGDALSALLCDLMHWCDRYSKIGWSNELFRAERHYQAETM